MTNLQPTDWAAQYQQDKAAGTIPQPPQGPPGPISTAISDTGNFLKGIGQGIVHPLAYAGTRIAQAGISALEPLMSPQGQAKAENFLRQPQQFFGMTIPPQQTGSAGAQQIVGQGLEDAAAIAGAGGFGLASPEAGLGMKVLQNAGVTGLEGAGLSGGQAMQQNANSGQVLSSAAKGFGAGAVVGGAFTALPAIFQRQAKPIMNPQDAIAAHPQVQAAQGELNTAQERLTAAQQARQAVAQPAVEGTTQFQQGVKQGESALGQKFGQAGLDIKNTDPNLKMNLSNQNLDALNAIKEDRQFSLPDYLNKDNIPSATVHGQELNLSKMNPKMAEAIQKATGQIQGETGASLDPVQTQDLIKQLNAKMYKPMADGTLQVDQRVADLTSQLKQQAQAAFGHVTDANGESVWNKAYQDYAQGAKITEDLKTLLGFKGGQNLSNVSENKLLNNIVKLGKTPEGKLQLQNAIDEFKTQTGVDLTNPTQAMHQILDKDMALEQAQGNVKEAQKGLSAAQKTAAKEVAQPHGFGKILARGGRWGDYATRFMLMRVLWKAMQKL